MIVNEALETEWQARVKGMLRAEMVKRNMKTADLISVLRRWGIEENERNLRNKIARGTFSATFFVQCLVAMDCQTLRLDGEFPNPAVNPELWSRGT
ncbi:DUF6471 domain-containing protein [Phenylobacterium sp. LH3H17]|uniref:DUF6471 domain-containing protein n=1 Tax=Phenylobacterium sp. LH3H17 TaxID=2903901 RepID=UPI0020C94273|nr:DUF6471 domain-containing protein [Phenylobacterium sp. LH3H17]UTP39805.1 DUF6471 domain-containing protein [Phenylobacterium sp. LH3H17]